MPGPAGGTSWAGDVLQPRSELIPRLWGPVHAKERGRLPSEVSVPFHERREGGDAVANKVVRLAKDVQVDLGHLRLQAHHFHLQEEGQGILARVKAKVASSAKACSHIPSTLPLC